MESPHKTRQGILLSIAAVWVFFSGWCVFGGYLLSVFGALKRPGIAIHLGLGIALSSWLFHRFNAGFPTPKKIKWKRYLKPFPLLYLACAALALTGGLFHPPTNYDALCYRVPRLLHWLHTGQCHWTGSFNARIDFSSHGFEWLMMPWFGTFGTFRFTFLINVISFLLMPGLIFSAFRLLGVQRAVAATWMWIIPCGSCFVMQAGSIGNDIIATTYVLSAIVFALKAREMGEMRFIWLAMISTGLMTGAKASNLPLLLPVGICFVALYLKRPQLLIRSTGAIIVGILVSYVPLAVINYKHTGDWTGSPNNTSKLNDPVAGLCGNSLQIAIGGLSPAVFPGASSWNKWVGHALEHPPLAQIKSRFRSMDLDMSEMATEEGSGLGLGVTAAVLLGGFWPCRGARRWQLPMLGTVVALGFWGAMLPFMSMLGNAGTARLLASYYPGLIVLPLLLFNQKRLIRARWWVLTTCILLIPIVPALLFNPARPFLKMTQLIAICGLENSLSRVYNRSHVVYETYQNRSDIHRAVRELLPSSARVIGFAGTSDESEYSFWLPLGKRTVRDFTPLTDFQLPDTTGLDAIVTSEWGCNDRFNMTPEQLARTLKWRIIGTTKIQTYASAGDHRWNILVPDRSAIE